MDECREHEAFFWGYHSIKEDKFRASSIAGDYWTRNSDKSVKGSYIPQDFAISWYCRLLHHKCAIRV